MTTKAGHFRDLIFESKNNAAVRAWFVSTKWRGWIDEKEFGGPNFDPIWTVSKWRRSGGSAIVYLRLLEVDYQELRRLNPPMDSINILANADPFKRIGINGDVTVRSVFHQVKSDPVKVAIIRAKYPREVDDDGETKRRGLRFGGFGDRFDDPKGDLELDVT